MTDLCVFPRIYQDGKNILQDDLYVCVFGEWDAGCVA